MFKAIKKDFIFICKHCESAFSLFALIKKMSVIYEQKNCKLIKHSREFQICTFDNGEIVEYKLSEVLFNNFKRKQKEKVEIASEMKTKVVNFLTDCKKEKLFQLTNDENAEKMKKENVELMNKFYACSSDFGFFHGENNLSFGKVVTMGSKCFIIPPNCKFFNNKIKKLESCLPPNDDNKFDFIVIDPPWKNRYIKRVKKKTNNQGYFMMSDDEICKIPLENYTKKTSIVVIWCTNSETHVKAIKERLLAKWQLKLLATWQWVKVDMNGELFCSIDGNKKPFEQIFIATHQDSKIFDGLIENECLIFSQPSSIHSHKPPLLGK